MDWAELIIGAGPKDWRHSRFRGLHLWTVVHGTKEAAETRAATDADLLRSLTPGTLLVAVGPGAAGKSTFASTEAVPHGMTVVCLDTLRHEISGDAGDQSVTAPAVEQQNALLESHLSSGRSVFLDSTNVETRVRSTLVERARRHGRPAVAMRFLVHLDICRARNRRRQSNREVRDDVLVWQHEQMLAARPQALLAEGFTAAHDVAVSIP
ncbi:AAA family ATPase [Streptomyces sp. NBC_00470]|uniref:AAA family ATPase n=1 Tax=Streptomyces sp. NBC_00470 TaxID=2975753 RepID=UPI0030E4E6D4